MNLIKKINFVSIQIFLFERHTYKNVVPTPWNSDVSLQLTLASIGSSWPVTCSQHFPNIIHETGLWFCQTGNSQNETDLGDKRVVVGEKNWSRDATRYFCFIFMALITKP